MLREDGPGVSTETLRPKTLQAGNPLVLSPKPQTQTFQNPLIKEYTLNYNRIPDMK